MVSCLRPGDAAGAPAAACRGRAGRARRATRCNASRSSARGWSAPGSDPTSARQAAACRQPARPGSSAARDAPASYHRAAPGSDSAPRVRKATRSTTSSPATGRRGSASSRRATDCRSAASSGRTTDRGAAGAGSPTNWRAPGSAPAPGSRGPGASGGTAGPASAPGSRGPASPRRPPRSRCAGPCRAAGPAAARPGRSIFIGAQVWGRAHKGKTDVRALVDHLAASSQFQEVDIGQTAVRLARSERG